MKKHLPRMAALALSACTASAGFAAGEKQSRYTMSPADGGGFVRLDTETGQMSLCQRREGDWSCRDMTEPHGGLPQEVDRLREENRRLKAEIRQMEDIMLGDKRAEAPQKESRGLEFKLPSEQDIDSAMDYVTRMVRKFREKMKELEAESKGTPL